MSIDFNVNELEYEKNYDGFLSLYNTLKSHYQDMYINGVFSIINKSSSFEVLQTYIDKISSIEDEIQELLLGDDDQLENIKLVLLMNRFSELKNDFFIFKFQIYTNNRIQILNRAIHRRLIEAEKSINEIKESADEFKNSEKELRQIEKDLRESEKELKQIEQELKNSNYQTLGKIKNYEIKLEESERKVVSHSTNFMSLLAAIIAIVVSSITTASTWLNNTNKDGLAIAIIAPAFVIIIAILVLLSFCSLIYNKELWIKVFSGVILTIGIAVIILYSINELPKLMEETKYANVSHTLIILDENEYDVIDEQYFSFKYEGIIYKFDYDESYIHDDNLYFCIEHKTLE